jgi:hypothetical protein
MYSKRLIGIIAAVASATAVSGVSNSYSFSRGTQGS